MRGAGADRPRIHEWRVVPSGARQEQRTILIADHNLHDSLHDNLHDSLHDSLHDKRHDIGKVGIPDRVRLMSSAPSQPKLSSARR